MPRFPWLIMLTTAAACVDTDQRPHDEPNAAPPEVLEAAATTAAALVAPRAECANPTASQLDACIDDAWDALFTDVSVGARSYFADYVAQALPGGRAALDDLRLYGLQRMTGNLLMYAHAHRKVDILKDLASLYLAIKPGFTTQTTYVVAHVPKAANGDLAAEGRVDRTVRAPSAVANRRRAIKATRYWNELARPGEANATGENILSSSQFMYAVARLIRATAELPADQRPAELTAFVTSYLTLAVDDHYKRWVLGRANEVGLFNVPSPWLCGTGKFTHARYLQLVLAKQFNTTPSYCNLITDQDWWIAAGVAELLLARRQAPTLVAFDDPQQALSKYVKTAAAVFASRTRPTSVEGGLGFGVGEWDDHVDFAFMGYPRAAPLPALTDARAATGVGWDIRHARRWIHLFDSFQTFTRIYGPIEWPTDAQLKGFAVQFAVAVPTVVVDDAGARCLKFRNLMSGHNGWYRYTVGMADALATAGPFSRSADAAPAGYAFWSKHDARVGNVVRRWMTENAAWMRSSARQLEVLPSLADTRPYPAVEGGCQVP